jgi:hypothetical protein
LCTAESNGEATGLVVVYDCIYTTFISKGFTFLNDSVAIKKYAIVLLILRRMLRGVKYKLSE